MATELISFFIHFVSSSKISTGTFTVMRANHVQLLLLYLLFIVVYHLSQGLTQVHLKSTNCETNEASRWTSILKWTSGPFVFNISCITDDKVQDTTLDIYDGSLPLHASDLGLEPLQFREILSVRLRVAVRFTHNQPSNVPSYELRWAHFRGNTRLVALDDGGLPLLVQQGSGVVQHTHAGHLFVVMLPESEKCDVEVCNTEGRCTIDHFDALDCQMSRVVGVCLVPVIHQQCSHTEDCLVEIPLDPLNNPFHDVDAILALSSCPYRSGTAPATFSPAVLSGCFREMLMIYWEHQRLTQVDVNMWAVPPIPVAASTSLPTAQYNTEQVVTESGGLLPNSDPTSTLWTVVSLPEALTAELRTFHRNNRATVSVAEPPISLVFNQFEARTYYTPLPAPLLDALVAEAQRATALWLGVRTEELRVTGAYGSREYRTGALVRWHVDPADTQPLTAIIHIADSGTHSEFSVRNWAIELPRELSHISNDSAVHKVYLAEGELLLIQSAKVPHARLVPYLGEWYANAFVHFAPHGWVDREAIRQLSG